MTTDKRGVSALLLQRQLGLSSYETVWMMLHKLRRAMVNASREPLHGEVEGGLRRSSWSQWRNEVRALAVFACE